MSSSSDGPVIQYISGLMEQGKPGLLFQEMNLLPANSPCQRGPRARHHARAILDLPIG
jgi:hypothetical protein